MNGRTKCISGRTRYLEPTDPGAFDDFPVQALPGERFPEMKEYTALCPQCQGHGGWNLRLNAYGPGKHFRCHCSNCNGWGYVKPEDAGHVHEWKYIRNTDRCLNLYRCVGCGRVVSIDSSD